MFWSTVEEKWERLLGNGIAWQDDSVQQTTDLIADFVTIKNNLVVRGKARPCVWETEGLYRICAFHQQQHQRTDYCLLTEVIAPLCIYSYIICLCV